MGACACVNLRVVPAIWTGLEFRYLGRRPGICILGGQGEGVWGVEDGSAGGQRGGKGAVPLLPFSLSLASACLARSLSLFLSPSLSMCSAAPAVGLPTHSLSQGHTGRSLRDHFCTPTRLGRPQPAGGTHWSDGD